MKSLLMILCVFLASCGPSREDSIIVGYLRDGLIAYQQEDGAALMQAVSALESYGDNQSLGSSARHDALAGSSQLLALVGILRLHLPTVTRFAYVERLCAASWADALYADPVSTCSSVESALRGWGVWTTLTNPRGVLAGEAEAKLVAMGLLMASPHKAAHLPFYAAMHLEPLRPQPK